MLNSQLHQHQTSQLQHHQIPSSDHGTNGYFIFDDLTTALQLQDRSNNDQLSAIPSSISSPIGVVTTLHHHQQQQQQSHQSAHLTMAQQQQHQQLNHSLPMLASSSPPTASHVQQQKCNFGELI